MVTNDGDRSRRLDEGLDDPQIWREKSKAQRGRNGSQSVTQRSTRSLPRSSTSPWQAVRRVSHSQGLGDKHISAAEHAIVKTDAGSRLSPEKITSGDGSTR